MALLFPSKEQLKTIFAAVVEKAAMRKEITDPSNPKEITAPSNPRPSFKIEDTTYGLRVVFDGIPTIPSGSRLDEKTLRTRIENMKTRGNDSSLEESALQALNKSISETAARKRLGMKG